MLGLGDQLRVALNLDHDGGRVPRPVVRPAPTLAAVADGVGDEGALAAPSQVRDDDIAEDNG